jgi:hypothetical protein
LNLLVLLLLSVYQILLLSLPDPYYHLNHLNHLNHHYQQVR